ncbi:GNAT family N-acetyltransferase [Mycobacterium szulgai]|uniref:Lysine N-acyltransferase MbtK n=1 Tax=Mycobacterium szulgai TaxID=1787 RepID=A0A1X2F5Q1_MYCSZ|nr:GNAT family N-acetyltransferase [Mycobacterium szulgai]MCV7076782.1 acetyltransferase [Mycobacterium szulgai]ORX13745.1 GCN5 family acetyltransferase [Mycobacterium szulgai]
MYTPDLRHRCAGLEHEEFSGEFSLRRLCLDRDVDLLHAWMNDPEVARFWKKAWPPREIAAYLQKQEESAHSTAYVGELNGIPMSYWELYRADLDQLAHYYAARDHDAGVHLLLGPAECRGRGLAVKLLNAVSTWQLDADPRADRVIAEPDVDNQRSIRAFERAGFRRTRDVELPNKRAALMVRDREPHEGSPSQC